MNWLAFSFFTVILYGIHDVVLKHLSEKTNIILSSFIINFSASIAMLLLYFYSNKSNDRTLKSIQDDLNSNLLLLIIAGVCLGTATITFMKSFSKGGSFSIALPLVYVGIILLSVIVGRLFFNESISPTQMLGISLSTIGLFLLVKS